ncbi:hypothetical protein CEXT_187621 [Caerostris extrusa]|uniref:Maturase K n=1 Tax=Caerostris extrusa TaxID=172846 RepID=A0AAV4WWA6_CAEEX|nr:hypothetical protein CEXT_187621 [Caerostris extrusa]
MKQLLPNNFWFEYLLGFPSSASKSEVSIRGSLSGCSVEMNARYVTPPISPGLSVLSSINHNLCFAALTRAYKNRLNSPRLLQWPSDLLNCIDSFIFFSFQITLYEKLGAFPLKHVFLVCLETSFY